MSDLFADFNFRAEIDKIWARRWLIIGACLITGIIAVTVTSPFIMKPEFKSTASLFPPSISSITRLDFAENMYHGIEQGEVEDVDRVVALLKASDLKDMMAEKYNLMVHYNIDSEFKGPIKTATEKFYKRYDDNVNVVFTQFSTVQIDVYDSDANRKEGLRLTELNIQKLSVKIDSIRDSLQYYRTKYQIYRVENLSDVIAEYLYRNTKLKPAFHEFYDRAMTLETQMFNLNLILADQQREVFYRRKNLDIFPSLIHVINYAKPAKHKSRPKRTLILASTFGGTLLMMLFLVILLDRKKRPPLPI